MQTKCSRTQLPVATSAALQSLCATGALTSAERSTLLQKNLGWDKRRQQFNPTKVGVLSPPAYWQTMFTLLDVLTQLDDVYPQVRDEDLYRARGGILSILAENRRWRTQYLRQGYDPHVLVVNMLRALWVTQCTNTAAEAALSIFTQWTRRKTTIMNSIAVSSEAIGKTFFGAAWWTLCVTEDDHALYHLVQKDKPPFQPKWLPACLQEQVPTVLPSNADYS